MTSFIPGHSELLKICEDHNDDEQEWLGFELVCLYEPDRRHNFVDNVMSETMRRKFHCWRIIYEVSWRPTIRKSLATHSSQFMDDSSRLALQHNHLEQLAKDAQQARKIDLPNQPLVLDEVLVSYDPPIVARIERYEHGCSAAYICREESDINGELSESNQLLQSYWFTLKQYDPDGQRFEIELILR